jgi:hypothetical protein
LQKSKLREVGVKKVMTQNAATKGLWHMETTSLLDPQEDIGSLTHFNNM